jgi:membrane-associated protease RseP (regulator of RpoE activity)
MNSKRWFLIAPVLGFACVIILGTSAMQAQVGTQPKNGEKAARTAPSVDRAAPSEADRVDPTSKAARRTTAEERSPQGRDAGGRDALSHNRDSQQGGGWLGVYVAEADEKNPAAGVQISQIFPASPAARAGFRGGDIITQVNDQKVADPQAFIQVIESMPPGTKATFAIQRNNQPAKLTATLGQNYWVSQEQGDFDGRYQSGGRGRQEEEYPIHALELEHNRRMAEQHERMEQLLVELKEEVKQLRDELKNRK